MSEIAMGRQSSRRATAVRSDRGSNEVGTVAVVAAAVLALLGFGPGMLRSAFSVSRAYLGGFTSVEIGPGAVTPLAPHLAGNLATMLLPLGVVVALAGVGAGLAGRPLVPALLHPEPGAGLRRIISRRGGFELGKMIVKLALVGGAVAWTVRFALEEALPLGPSALASAVRVLPETMLQIAAAGTLALGTVAMLDLGFRRRARRRRLALPRGLQDDLRGRRMVRETRNADVVVADHGRLAVALRYEPGRMRAPRVVACGARLHARRLCEIATEARIPVVQNPTVARSLQLRCDVGGEIPRALYETVAELLADVYRARAAARSSHVWPCSRSPRPRPVSTSIGTVKLGDE